MRETHKQGGGGRMPIGSPVLQQQNESMEGTKLYASQPASWLRLARSEIGTQAATMRNVFLAFCFHRRRVGSRLGYASS